MQTCLAGGTIAGRARKQGGEKEISSHLARSIGLSPLLSLPTQEGHSGPHYTRLYTQPDAERRKRRKHRRKKGIIEVKQYEGHGAELALIITIIIVGVGAGRVFFREVRKNGKYVEKTGMVGSLPKGRATFARVPRFFLIRALISPFGRGGIYARAILWSSPFPDVLGWLGKTVEQTL